jgi:hypothetical protein
MVQIDNDPDVAFLGEQLGEQPGDVIDSIADSIVVFPRQRFNATAGVSVSELVSTLGTDDGDVIDDIDLRDIEVERTEARGKFLVRVRGHHNKALAAGVIVTGAGLIAAALGVRYRTGASHGTK